MTPALDLSLQFGAFAGAAGKVVEARADRLQRKRAAIADDGDH